MNKRIFLAKYVYTIIEYCSLSQRGRDAGVVDSWKFILGHQTNSDAQIFGGDFNAEPMENSLMYLTCGGQATVPTSTKTVLADVTIDGNIEDTTISEHAPYEPSLSCNQTYHDAYQPCTLIPDSSEITPGSDDAKDQCSNTLPFPDFVDTWVHQHGQTDGFTFPSCNPIKRIDYLLARNTTGSSNEHLDDSASSSMRRRRWDIVIKDSRIVGVDPTADTSKYNCGVHMLFSFSGIYFFI